MKRLNKALLTLTFVLSSFFAIAETSGETIAKYFQEGEKGWFWYESLPKETQQKIQQAIQQVLSGSLQAKPTELSPAWFRQHFQQYMDKAQANPYDKEAMRTYLYLEKYMRDQAEAFAYQRQAAVYADPFLDGSSQRGTASFAAQAMTQNGEKIKRKLLTELSSSFGIYFFYRSDCSYCHQQAPLLKLLSKKYGFTIKPVSLDGKALAKSDFNEFLIDRGQAKALNVRIVPSLFVFDLQNKTTISIAQGLQSLIEIEKRIVYAAQRQGYISEEELNQTRGKGLYPHLDGSKNTQVNLPQYAPKAFLELYKKSMEHH